MKTLVLLALVFSLQEKETRLKFAVQHDTGAKDGIGARKLTPEEERGLEKEVRSLSAVKEVACKGSVVSLVLAPGSTLKWTEFKAAAKRVPTPDGGFNQVVFNTLKLEGQVTLTLNVEKNRDRVKTALKTGPVTEVAESGDGWDCKIKSPGVDVLSLIKIVAAKCEVEYRVFDILKDITWRAP